ncbi:CBN-CUTL-24 protein [Caenorhabditis brenneri]|uniref:CBN-CUTL-24 protein n=1 Tax=Caenorhabditis brenneri TaxID=135651 RepID=G0P9G6_CAEBE|nr:CBN-CUTL-24 protein [Caenorhabditis brenneri]
MRRSLLLFLLYLKFCQNQYVTPQYAEIRAVSAMCSSDGITASIDFDKPFTGKVYSLNYANSNDCLYYNNIDRDTVLFSIPAQQCGTKLQRTTRNMIDQMENRVYVQMDKDTQTSADKQFSFVCRLTDPLKTVAKDDGIGTKDSYQQQPIRPVASSVSTKMHSSLMPIKPSEVRQVAAFSRDSHLGNWPIPGAKPYEPSMKPVSTYPMSPISPDISAPNPTLAKDASEGYVTRPISTVGLPSLPPPLFPNLPPQQIPQRSPPVIARVFTTSTMPPIMFTFPPTTTTPPLPFPIIPNVHFKQGVGVPFAPGVLPSTKVDASQWNDPNAYATPPTVPNTIVDSTTPKTYREQPPTADAPFSSDNSNSKEILESSTKPESKQKHHQADDPGRNAVTSVLKTTQEQQIEPEVTLEIQRGEGPFAPPVTTPIKIGDNISLVVKAKSYLNESDQFDMFVHSCFATDGKGDTKVQMIDENGCVIRREFASPLHRAKDSENMMFYYLLIKAFKFPGPDDVYFSCTIEFTPMIKAPNICSKLRRRREILENGMTEMRLFDSVSVELENGDTNVRTEQLSSSEDCDDEKHIYILVIVILLVSTTLSLVSNLYQFVRAQYKR